MKYTIKELRKHQYDYHIKYFPFIDDYIHHPYSFLKTKFYMAASAILIFYLLKTRITPNSLTVTYALAGVVGGVLLAIPHPLAVQIGVLLFFTKGILDWADGHYARITKMTTLRGHVLDMYGAHLGALGLQIGLGFFVAWRNELYTTELLVLVTMIPFLYAARLTFFADAVILKDVLDGGLRPLMVQDVSASNKSTQSFARKTYNSISSYMDDRARTVDLICLLMLIELYSTMNITWMVFLLLVIKQWIICAGSFYIVVQGQWVENKVQGEAGREE
ncbi:MAG: CDP-alcohol phosphatidyltransferase family protein [Magnetococcales bacterium]|nr:CDP-alcohol phosphatidyltransferase family protein [Magnetococcales bacterium]